MSDPFTDIRVALNTLLRCSNDKFGDPSAPAVGAYTDAHIALEQIEAQAPFGAALTEAQRRLVEG